MNAGLVMLVWFFLFQVISFLDSYVMSGSEIIS